MILVIETKLDSGELCCPGTALIVYGKLLNENLFLKGKYKEI